MTALSKEDIKNFARDLGFVDAGFTSAEPFESQREILDSKREEYSWCKTAGIDLMAGTDPRNVYPDAKSIIVLVEAYYRYRFPAGLERHFGRCYLDDDRVTRDGLAVRIKSFRQYLRDAGIESKVPFNVPHRLAAARAGLGTFGKNCLFYSTAAQGSSWVSPVALLVDREFMPDAPTMTNGCPSWCRNACVAACPTRALKGDGTIDPRKCISFLTYYGQGLTPRDIREQMGLYVYGCDRCQNVCPRNDSWTSREFPENEKVAARAINFSLESLLHMDRPFFLASIWPHMFYIPPDDIWRWKMNAARAMGNSRDGRYVPDLVRAFKENTDERVRSMAVWALGRIGGAAAKKSLVELKQDSSAAVAEELDFALQMCG